MSTSRYNMSSSSHQQSSFSDKIGVALQFNNLSQQTKEVLTKVYTALTVAIISAILGVSIAIYFSFRLNGFLAIATILGSSIWFYSTPHTRENENKRFLQFNLIAFLMGMNISYLIEITLFEINPQIVLTAFLSTAAIFVSFSVFSLLTDKRLFLYIGSTLVSLSLVIFILSIFTLFNPTETSMKAIIYLYFFTSVGFIVFDTQHMVYRIEQGDKDFLKHAMNLFRDFYDLFHTILIILNDKNKKQEKNRR
eukprot:gene2756-3429_t